MHHRPHLDLIVRLLRSFENDPHYQIMFHLAAMGFWMINAIIGTLLIVLLPHLWVSIGVFYVFMLSVYANWSTDYGAVSAAQANQHSEWLVRAQDDRPVSITVEELPPEG